MKSLPIILDTDIGDDVDDALALAIILNSPELELRGITTVFRNAPRRALLAQHILRAFGRDNIPIAAGCSKPLLQPFAKIRDGARLGSQFEVLEENSLKRPLPHAVDFLVQSVDLEAEPDTENLLTIVPIGPLTNIALALAREPELISRCRLVLMGGQWSEPIAEWNVLCDPEAAAMVFDSGIEITMIGYDVTSRCQLSEAQTARLATGSTQRAQLLSQLLKLWQSEVDHPVTLHDPLAVISLFDDCVRFEDKRIEVALCGEQRACTIVTEGKPNARVAVDVDVERAVELFMQRVLD